MEILGIGLPELVFIFIIALLILGPKDMQKAGKTVGRWLNRLINSDAWKVVRRSSLELRNLPTNLMREANLDMQKTDEEIRNSLRINPRMGAGNPPFRQNSINPPVAMKASAGAPTAQPENKEQAPESEPENNA
ncbi:MAG: twin-arginine translocase TatA/TatE family subunit [Chloroflexi bacterium]|nr:twin-arginine translocase TatA/TatE family subunit [Chloroflexota bacterium]